MTIQDAKRFWSTLTDHEKDQMAHTCAKPKRLATERECISYIASLR